MQIDRRLVSKKELSSLGIPYSFQHIARLEKAGQFPPAGTAWPLSCRVELRGGLSVDR